MKLYHSLSEAVAAFKRKSREVFAIISFNSQAYFVFRSEPSPDKATKIQAKTKMLIGNELKKSNTSHIDLARHKKLYGFMLDAGVSQQFPNTQHAEEKLIHHFPDIINEFKMSFKNQKINSIDIFLTHSPCSDQGEKKYSAKCYINDFLLPPGCEGKLSVFFKKEHYKSSDKQLFSEKTKVKVRYNHKFDSSVTYGNDNFIKEADPILKEILVKGLDGVRLSVNTSIFNRFNNKISQALLDDPKESASLK